MRRSLRICLVARPEPGTTGTSRYVECLSSELKELGLEVSALSTRPSGAAASALAAARRMGLDFNAFLASYPLRLRWPPADVYHLTVQTYAGLLLSCPPPGPTVVTVHDIIPYLVRRDHRLRPYRHPVHRALDWVAMRGLRRADRIFADSEWTRRTLVEALGVDACRVTTLRLGVDQTRFRPLKVPADFRERFGLSEHERYVLYIGSEDPRKNLETLWRAFARVHTHHPEAVLLKVGAPQSAPERNRLLHLRQALAVSGAIRFLDHVAEEDLPVLYNLACVCVLPSLYEGFGLPVLEALACGTRVVCSNVTALPEVVGADSLVCEPTADGIAAALEETLAGDGVGADARRRWASGFSWRRSAEAANHVYQALAMARAVG